ncbi:MAG: type II toxin-antitoxin system RelE/ParE family toxin [Cyanobacteriota bacterium]
MFGNPVDVRHSWDGVSELPINYCPGYRVYFQKRGSVLIILLADGDKSTQAKDIKSAQDLARNFKEDE